MYRKSPVPEITIDTAVLQEVRAMAAGPTRQLLGLVGAPGAGKSTLAAALIEALNGTAVNVPMDGFHLSQHQLDRLGRAGRKGAPDTFDGNGYRALLTRLHNAAENGEIVYTPAFYREIEEPIAASLAVAPDIPLVITEGNYLLLDETPWPAVAEQLDAVWYLDIDNVRREDWLIARHQRFGRSEAEARAWMAATDRPNAERIAPTVARADRVLCWNGNRVELAG